MTTQTLIRVFRFGSIQLPDPDPALTPSKVKDIYAANHPHLALADIADPVQEGEQLVYKFIPQPVETKG